MNVDNDRLLHTGKHLRLVSRRGWEFVERVNCTGVVGIIAITSANRLVLVEQHRVPLGVPVIELPAGLAGDEPGAEQEDWSAAARRELLEETGYQAGSLIRVASGPASAGMCTECMTLYLARNVQRTAAGGGVHGEQITIHEVPLVDIERFVAEQESAGKLVDMKVFVAAYFALRQQGTGA